MTLPREARPPARPLTFLIADDHGIVRHGLKELIADAFTPALLVEADRGQQVLDEVRARPFDLVVLDIGLPDIPAGEGFERRFALPELGHHVRLRARVRAVPDA